MYGGAHGLAVRSLLSLQSYLISTGHQVTFDIVTGGSILPKVRNGIVKRFIDSPAEVLVFIDSDMVYTPETIETLAYSQFDIAVANYRNRHSEVKWMAEAKRENGEVLGTQVDGNTWISTDRAGTGIMAIKRTTIERMMACYPRLRYEDNGTDYPCLFDFRLSEGKYHGEDYSFCKLAIDAGCKIYILADCFIGHIGDTVYGGNYHEYLLSGS